MPPRLLIMSFTNCDGCYSLKNVLRKHFPSCQRFLGGGALRANPNEGGVLNPKLEISPGKHVPRTRELGQLAVPRLSGFSFSLRQAVMASAPDAGDSLWAKNLFRLQCSLLYFFAAEFKIQPEWLGPHGGTLIKARPAMLQCQGHVLAGHAVNLSRYSVLFTCFHSHFEWCRSFHLTIPPSTFKRQRRMFTSSICHPCGMWRRSFCQTTESGATAEFIPRLHFLEPFRKPS